MQTHSPALRLGYVYKSKGKARGVIKQTPRLQVPLYWTGSQNLHLHSPNLRNVSKQSDHSIASASPSLEAIVMHTHSCAWWVQLLYEAYICVGNNRCMCTFHVGGLQAMRICLLNICLNYSMHVHTDALSSYYMKGSGTQVHINWPGNRLCMLMIGTICCLAHV